MAAQYNVFLWCFSIILRYLGISDRRALLAMGVVLILATVAVFGFALWRANDEVKLLLRSGLTDAEGRESDEEEESAPGRGGDTSFNVCDIDEEHLQGQKRNGNSPLVHTEMEAAAVIDTVDDRRGIDQSKQASPWQEQLFGLCGAEPEHELAVHQPPPPPQGD